VRTVTQSDGCVSVVVVVVGVVVVEINYIIKIQNIYIALPIILVRHNYLSIIISSYKLLY
jgi:hypothetical protein